jgi:DnaJ family protein A protein 2
VVNNTDFERSGLDLLIHKNISLKDALCGFSFELKYINNKVYTIHNNSGNIIQPEYRKVIQSMGLEREDKKGNLIIIFHIQFPEKLSEDAIEQLKLIL